MSGRVRLAWAIVAFTAVVLVADAVLLAQYMTLFSVEALSDHGWPAVQAAALSSAVMGAVVVTRLPRHPIGWLLVLGGVVTPVSLATEAYSEWVLQGDGPGTRTLAEWVSTFSQLLNASVGLATLTLIFLLAPNGRFASSWWKAVAVLAVAGPLIYDATVLSVAPSSRAPADAVSGFDAVTMWIARSGFMLAAVALIAAVVSLLRRLRRARGVEHQQLRWIVASAGMMAGGLVISLLSSGLSPGNRLFQIPFFLAYLAFPVCVAVAVLRYRLFDLDLIVNRALVLTFATGLVAAAYVLVVVAISSAVGTAASGVVPSLLATAVVALAFQPLRRRVVRLADRMVYGESATPYEALADFSRRLGDSPDPTALLPTVADAAGNAVGARAVTVRLFVPGGGTRDATWPVDGSPVPPGGVEVDVVDRDERLGSFALDMPPGRPLRPRDRVLLQDLADQAGIAFRNARLSAVLAGRVAELDRRVAELAESRRRLVSVADAERQRLERAIARDVVPHLAPLSARLRELARAPVAPAQVPPLIGSANTALEALREITRGVFPAQLERSGFVAALSSHVARLPDVRLDVADTVAGARFESRVEAAAYFTAVETLRELGRPAAVAVDASDGRLCVTLSGPDSGGLDLTSLRDRTEAVGGTVQLRSGERSEVAVVLPWGRHVVELPTADHTSSSRSGLSADLVQ